jgi:NAD-dependent dihydropyrimidine dehydrogenase PreA subunit
MISISKNRCVGCGICEIGCPVGSISVDVNKGFAILDENKCIDCGLCLKNCPQGAIKKINKELMIAFGTDNKKNIKQDGHIGMSKFFQIWKYSTGKITFKETRENAKYKEDETKIHGDPGKAKATSSVLDDIDVLVGKMIGPNIKRLKNNFVPVIIREPDIKKALRIIMENINKIFEEKEKTERSGIVLK